MKIAIIKEEAALTSVWAGGIGKQYFIFPYSASFAARDFSIRLSMAIATSDEEAKFTPLDNITRHLIVLEGTSNISHKGHYDIVMHPYDQIDVFDGGWETFGKGKITDFNMQLDKNIHGNMSIVDKNRTVLIGGCCETCHNPYNMTAFFCGHGSSVFNFSTEESLRITKGDLLLIEDVPSDIYAAVELLDSKLVRMDWCSYSTMF